MLYADFNGGIIRFMPGEDIKTLFPLLYNMEYGDNQEYIDSDPDLDGIIEKMGKQLVDKQFEAWQAEYAVETKQT